MIIAPASGGARFEYYDVETDTESSSYGHYYEAHFDADVPLHNVLVNSAQENAVPIFVNLDDDTDLELVVGAATSGNVGILKYLDKNNSGTYVELTSTNNPFNGLTFPYHPFLPLWIETGMETRIWLLVPSREP